MVRFIGGPADGSEIDQVTAGTVQIIGRLDHEGFGTFTYTLRKARNVDGELVEVLVPAGMDAPVVVK